MDRYNLLVWIIIRYGSIIVNRSTFNSTKYWPLQQVEDYMRLAWVSDCCLTPNQHFSLAISWQEQVNFQCDDGEVGFVLDQHAELDFIVLAHWNNSPQVDNVVPFRHIILIPSQPVFALTPKCYSA